MAEQFDSGPPSAKRQKLTSPNLSSTDNSEYILDLASELPDALMGATSNGPTGSSNGTHLTDTTGLDTSQRHQQLSQLLQSSGINPSHVQQLTNTINITAAVASQAVLARQASSINVKNFLMTTSSQVQPPQVGQLKTLRINSNDQSVGLNSLFSLGASGQAVNSIPAGMQSMVLNQKSFASAGSAAAAMLNTNGGQMQQPPLSSIVNGSSYSMNVNIIPQQRPLLQTTAMANTQIINSSQPVSVASLQGLVQSQQIKVNGPLNSALTYGFTNPSITHLPIQPTYSQPITSTITTTSLSMTTSPQNASPAKITPVSCSELSVSVIVA